MKKLFSVFALLVMALTTASATKENFSAIDFSGSGTNTLTATQNGITIENATASMDIDGYDFEFGSGTIKITATGTNVTFKGVNLLGESTVTDTETQDPKTGAGPWEYDVTNNKVNGSYIYAIDVEYEAAAPAAPTFGTTQTKYLWEAEITITRPYDGAEVRYTTNNLTPTATSGELLPADGKITVSEIPAGSNKKDYTIKAVTVKDGVASEVASLAIELIYPSLSVSNIPAKYEGWTALIHGFSYRKEKLEDEAKQSMVLYTSEIALQFTGSATWAEHYAKISGEGLETVTDNKFETDAVDTKYFDTYFAIAFFKDGVTCGSEYVVLTTDKITADADGKFTVSSLSADALASGNLCSDEDEVVISDNEMELAALMGSTVYAKDDMGERFYVNNKGQVAGMIVTEAFCLQFTLSSMAEIVKDGDDYVASTSDGQSVYRFVVEDGKVTKIEGKEHGEEKKYLPSTELTLAALMGTTEYVNADDYCIYVNELGKIMRDGYSFANFFTFSINASGNYVATGKNSLIYEYIFYVENGKVTKIEEYEDGALNSTYLPSVEDVLAALMGTTEYVNADDYCIYVNELGKIMRDGYSFANFFTFSINASGNYVATGKNGLNYEYIFYVVNNKVTKIEEYEDEASAVIYLPKQETPTAISAPAAEKAVKAYKTIENGEIVIIRGGERFNLRGAKIK